MGVEVILQRIEGDSEKETLAIDRQTLEKVESLRAASLEQAKKQAADILEGARKEAEEIGRRARLIAGLEARKNTLASKRASLDAAFDMALGQVCALSGERWENLISRIVLSACETGREQLRVPAKDRDRYTGAFLDRLNAALKAQGKAGQLTLSDTPGAISGGVLVVGESCDVNGSFEALLRQVRESCEREVSGLLFGSEVR
ncbi:MAG: V-type proton ATPase subunit E [Lachnospiraceae bacterium]|jgi:V/A-type H+-transporting ATPase subunit E|nr:V-type proton ATPase subunit E [Lachnospiraceae bacterium]